MTAKKTPAKKSAPAKKTPAKTFPWLDTKQPLEKRVQLLMDAMTIEEKISQIRHESDAIPRLGIPFYNWWNECLHGVGRAGKATVFPQSIGLGATFDEPLMREIGTAVSDEARAKHHAALRRGFHAMYFGLTFWTPNINLFRDPRWGRGQETYGEDPFLTARMGVAYIKGLQGNDPKYLKVSACAKHFAVHSGPEKLRHEFDAHISRRDLAESYLPQFEAAVKEARVESFMTAYNRVYGEACSASSLLLGDYLRGGWGHKGHVVSDAGAVDDIFQNHKVAPSMAAAAAMALKAGCDVGVGDAYRSLPEALEQGLVTAEDIDRALRNALTVRFRLGMFDPPSQVPYARIKPDVVNCEAHRRLAHKAARESMTLLKNEGNLLPLDPGKIRSVMVVGPEAYNPEALHGNYFGHSPNLSTFMAGLVDYLDPGVQVYYVKGCDAIGGTFSPSSVPSADPRDFHMTSARPDVILAMVGWLPSLEGEEGDAGDGDRKDIGLPGHQLELLKRLHATGKPVVAVVTSGSAVELEWAAGNIPAILMTWYPGEAGGRALAETLFGDNNPAGRLPVTVPRSLADVPPFEEYAMKGRTYRFSTKEPRYAFGHGLSYTTFRYSAFKPASPEIRAGRPLKVSVTVTNTGRRAGDEVVQVYLRHEKAPVPAPLLQLAAFKRIHLKAGASKTVTLAIRPEPMRLYRDDGTPFVPSGTCTLFAGGCQPGHGKVKTASFRIR
ncbi:MAG: glycoside hydrolase family 3 C-terminal domain-containing protein [Kiritimatiellia bacterium]|jgi:beta-glucosidase